MKKLSLSTSTILKYSALISLAIFALHAPAIAQDYSKWGETIKSGGEDFLEQLAMNVGAPVLGLGLFLFLAHGLYNGELSKKMAGILLLCSAGLGAVPYSGDIIQYFSSLLGNS